MSEQRKLIAERLRKRRLDLGLNLPDAALRITQSGDSPVSMARLSNWEQGLRAPKIEQYRALGKAYQVPAAYLAALENEAVAPEGLRDYVVPGSTVDAGGRLVTVAQSGGELALHLDYLNARGLTRERLLLVCQQDDSMRGTIEQGDLALIDMAVRHAKAADLFALLVGERIWLRWIRPEIDGSITIAAENSAHYPDMRLAPEELQNFLIVGRVASILHNR